MEMVMMWRIVYRSITRLAYIQVGLMWANCLPIHHKADIYPRGIAVEKCRPIHYQACIYRSGIAVGEMSAHPLPGWHLSKWDCCGELSADPLPGWHFGTDCGTLLSPLLSSSETRLVFNTSIWAPLHQWGILKFNQFIAVHGGWMGQG